MHTLIQKNGKSHARGVKETTETIGEEVNRMDKADIIRILNLVLEQEQAEECNGCKYIRRDAYDEPCVSCKRSCLDNWRPDDSYYAEMIK